MINDKKSKILIGCLALLLVMAVGYALFSETITINGTATAKGDFDITETCTVVTSENALDVETTNGLVTKGGTGSCSTVDGSIMTTSSLTKPSDHVNFRITFTNTGSIPAVLKTVDSPNNQLESSLSQGDEVYRNQYRVRAYYATIYNNQVLFGDSAFENANITLQPGESLIVEFEHRWFDMSTGQIELPKEGTSFNYNVTFGFEQVTAQ